MQYNRVNFGEKKLNAVNIKAASQAAARLEIRLDKPDGPLAARVSIPEKTEWNIVSTSLLQSPSGVHDVIVILENTGNVEIDWIKFE